jgi:hypothetical protein
MPGWVAAAVAVGVSRGGNGAPGGSDLLVGQVRPGGEPSAANEFTVSPRSWAAEHVIEQGRAGRWLLLAVAGGGWDDDDRRRMRRRQRQRRGAGPGDLQAAWPTARERAMPGSTVQACCTREEPFAAPHAADYFGGVSIRRRVPASSHTGCGYGVRRSQVPPSAVAAIRYRSSSVAARPCQDWALTCTPMPRLRPRSYNCHSGTRPDTAD